jgi:hypothetical protein
LKDQLFGRTFSDPAHDDVGHDFNEPASLVWLPVASLDGVLMQPRNAPPARSTR